MDSFKATMILEDEWEMAGEEPSEELLIEAANT